MDRKVWNQTIKKGKLKIELSERDSSPFAFT